MTLPVADLAQQALRATRRGEDIDALVDGTPQSLAAVNTITGVDTCRRLDAIDALQAWARTQTTDAFCDRLKRLGGGALVPVVPDAIAPYDQALSDWRVHYTAQAFEQPLVGPGGVRVIGVVYGHDADPRSAHQPLSWRLVADSHAPDSRWLGPTADEAFTTARDLARAARTLGGPDVEALEAQLWLLHQWALAADPDDLADALATAQQRVTEATGRLHRASLGTPFLRAVEQLATLTIECSILHASGDPRLPHLTHA